MATPSIKSISMESGVHQNQSPLSPRIKSVSMESGVHQNQSPLSPRLKSFSIESTGYVNTQDLVSPELERMSVEAGLLGGAAFTPQLKRMSLEAGNFESPTVTPLLKRFSIEAGNEIFIDDLAPATPTYGTLQGQQINGDPKGRTQVTVNWAAPTASQTHPGEYLGDATGGADALTVFYDPMDADPEVYEVTGYSVGGGDTTLSVAAMKGSLYLTVTDPANFTVNSWIEVAEGGHREYNRIDSINGSVLKMKNLTVCCDFTAAATVKNVDVTLKTITTDYTVNLASGAIDLVAGQFTASNPVFARYQQTISDLDIFQLYRIPGDTPLPDGSHIDEVTGHGGVVTLDAAIDSGTTQYVDVLDATLGGTSHTYYLFATDEVGNVSRAQSILIETFTSIIQNLSKTVGVEKVTLSWDANSEANFNGVNIYRSEGSWDPASALKVNSSLVTGTTFVDGAENMANRRPPVEVPYPVLGGTYFYVAEAEDTVTDWDTGTQNQAADPLQSENLIATKTD